jgi:hypothetical protein
VFGRAGSFACPLQPRMSVFFFGRKKAAPKRPANVQPSNEQKRSSFRMAVEFEVFYTLAGRDGRRHGDATDLSAGGLRLSTDEDFLSGARLDLEFRLPDDFLDGLLIEKEVFEQTPFGLRPETIKTQPAPFKEIRVRGAALSTFFVPEAKTLAHGIKFVDIEEETKEELQRFIHLWQVHQLRLRQESNR